MDLRILRYFLAVAREGNITRAAAALHITQPTLSRQMMDLEEELGTELLVRGKRQITLTNSGMLFQQRAKEIVSLMEKTERDLAEQESLVGGVVTVGCVETVASRLLADALVEFHRKYPMVRYEIYGADGDDIREKLDRGDIDVGILIHPVETAKYDFIRLPVVEHWGLLMRRDDKLAQRDGIDLEELLDLPLILSRRQIVVEEIAGWLGVESGRLRVIATHNLLSNSVLLVRSGLGYVICVQGAYTIRESEDLRFVPLSPPRTSAHVLAWKKNRIFTAATRLFVQQLEIQDGHDKVEDISIVHLGKPSV